MKPLRLGAIFLALVLAVTVAAIWQPWKIFDGCKAPEEFCVVASELESQEGVQEVAVDFEVTKVDAKDGDSSRATWTVHLDRNLDGTSAGELAAHSSEQIRTFSDTRPLTQSSLRFVAGEPHDSDVPNLKLYPLDVSDSDQIKEQLSQAFALLKLGATSVSQGSATAEDAKSMKILSRYAADHGQSLTLNLADGSVLFSSEPPLNTEALDLTLEVAALNSVVNTTFGSSGLSVHAGTASGSEQTARVKKWLSEHPPLKEPTPFTLSSPGYAEIVEGWIGNKVPESQIARPARLPEGVSSWPDNPAARSCAQGDLEVTLGSPDAALGSRYMTVFANNKSESACAVNGYPTIDFVNARGKKQQNLTLTPMPDIKAQRVVIPAGESIISALKWKAMSTANDPDVSTALSIVAARGFDAVELIPMDADQATPLDILDGGEVTQSPWLQALDGWRIPSDVGDQPARTRP
ncbi:DUF4232 domain-containing protein [Glutamicibacter sp. JC586]|uniref:DUF4232 domain-containing protein n=1 Tax=Glutamicibacter sp. JC586 TaxID=2590552 RepID=UPI0013571E37|nr:DUF4232 domain-containing protein [Glutamicibacter sp. JC586]